MALTTPCPVVKGALVDHNMIGKILQLITPKETLTRSKDLGNRYDTFKHFLYQVKL
jgi:hypothetical protein